MKIIGPFTQVVTLAQLPLRGSLADEQLEILENYSILEDEGVIVDIALHQQLLSDYPDAELVEISGDAIAIPGIVDCHTHICFGGNRANDFAMRNAGKSYLEIAEAGGGIWSSVQHTRNADENELLASLLTRIHKLEQLGNTTIEIKSGYGLNVDAELKMLRVIQKAQQFCKATLVPTCLSAHLKPKDFEGSSEAYLQYILTEILPIVQAEKLSNRVDIFIEKSAFLPDESKVFLEKAKAMGFTLTVHADQFTAGSSRIAVEVGAVSADHLEATSEEDIAYLAQSNTVAVALPGASLGLGEPFTPARKILDNNGILAIASDWNPGSAPMGNLICQASILATYQKLSSAEVWAGLTYRAAHALQLSDRGRLQKGMKADFLVYDTNNFQNILYQQGEMIPSAVYISGEKI
ncbi:MAG: imidazolonepropionase [Bacteroidetes bacterium]|nr:imidazolonepropionase [Bacteroidota bacterium]